MYTHIYTIYIIFRTHGFWYVEEPKTCYIKWMVTYKKLLNSPDLKAMQFENDHKIIS